MAREPWEVAIENVQRLMKARCGAEWWSTNIIDASAELEQKKDWALFYSYLANPQIFDPTKIPVTLDDLVEMPTVPDYPPELVETRHQNGTITLIEVNRVTDVDDEKISMNDDDDEKVE